MCKKVQGKRLKLQVQILFLLDYMCGDNAPSSGIRTNTKEFQGERLATQIIISSQLTLIF
jgi:hypothetical protein